MESKSILLTPDMARGFLENIDEKQRTISMGYAATIARDITDGRWREDYAAIDLPITISTEGKLSNGQHRCMAVVLANKPILTRVCYGVNDDMFEYMDNAKSRNAAQFIACKCASTVSSIARFAISMEKSDVSLRLAIIRPSVGKVSQNSSVQASRLEVIEYARENSEVLGFCTEQGHRIYGAFNRSGGGKGTFCCALWLLLFLNRATMEEITSFVDEICDPQPFSAAIARGKQLAMKKIIFAEKERVKIDKRFWFALILEMFDKRKTTSGIRGTTFVDKVIQKYSNMVDERRAKIELEQI